jgi:hypothetical protein
MSSSSTGLPTPEAPGSVFAFLAPHRDRHPTALETGAGS